MSIEILSVRATNYESALPQMTDSKGRTFFVRFDNDRIVLNTKENFSGRHAFVTADMIFELAEQQGRQPFGKAKVFRSEKEKKSAKPLKWNAATAGD